MENFIRTAKAAITDLQNKKYTAAFNRLGILLTAEITEKTRIKIIHLQARCQFNVGNTGQGNEILKSLTKKFPDTPLSWYYTGSFYANINNPELANFHLHKTIKDFPEFVPAYIVLADFLKNTKQSEEAIKVYNSLLRLNNLKNRSGIRRQDIMAELADLHYQRGEYRKCLGWLLKSREQDSAENFLHNELLARCYLQLGEPVKSLQAIEAYLRYGGILHSGTLVIFSRIHSKLNRLEEAGLIFRQALSIEPDLVLLQEDLADLAALKRIMPAQEITPFNTIKYE